MSLPDLTAMSVSELENLVRHHNELYWDANTPEISDYDYDTIVNRLRKVAPQSPVLSEMGPTSLGAPVRHREPMLSLDKCYSDEELEKWAQDFTGDVVMMPKFDGIACTLHYDASGRLVLAATRGDGVSGDDITRNARVIQDIPNQIRSDHPVEVRGEIYMRLSVFARYKAEGMANPRNLTAGAIKQKDVQKSAAYTLSFAAYDLVGIDFETHAAEMEFLERAGFPRIDYEVMPKDSMRLGYQKMTERRASLDYEIDGVVFKTNSIAEQNRLGSTAHHPRYAIAYKFQGDSGTTELKDVEWSVARSGAITPVAIVAPVELSGVSVERASLHHPGFLAKLGLSRGAQVVIMRRGGVIPNVEFVAHPGHDPIEIPRECPSCKAPVVWDKDFLFCSAPETCPAVAVGRLAHYASAVDMLGFGDVILEQCYRAGLLRSAADFYTLTPEHLSRLERCGAKLAKKLVGEVDKKRRIELATFLRALGIPELGKHVSKILAERYGNLDTILAIPESELSAVHTIGNTIAHQVVSGLKDNLPLIEELRKHVSVVAERNPIPSTNSSDSTSRFSGKTFVFTGKLQTLDRKGAEAIVVRHGGIALDSVNKNLSYLVVGDQKTSAPSTKEKAAEKLIAAGAQIQIMTESQFLELAQSNNNE